MSGWDILGGISKGTVHIDDLVQDCSISSVSVMEVLQFCTKPLISTLCISSFITLFLLVWYNFYLAFMERILFSDL